MFRLILLVGAFGLIVNFGETTIQYTETISTSGGSLRGEEVEFEGIKFKSFKGIPYAAPPVGKYRFTDPRPAEIWENVKDAIQFGNICHQVQIQRIPIRNVFQNEDCLTLNVYTKKLGKQAVQPVLFVIHGGDFLSGDGNDDIYGPEFLVQQDLVVVTFNYRLGPLGFLSTNTANVSGNWGLKDQVAALKWVQENIAQFGGDPKRVTLYGNSAGGSSAHFHMFSPLSKGLFHRVIVSSGIGNCFQALSYDQERFSENLALHLGASEQQAQDTEKRVEFLRRVDAKILSEGMWGALENEDLENNLYPPIPFLPVWEPPNTKNAFIIDNPVETITGGGEFQNVPLMVGFNDNEAGFLTAVYSNLKDPEKLKKLDENLCVAIPQYWRDRVEEADDCPKVTEEIRKFYFGGKPIQGQFANLTNLVSDSLTVHETILAEAMHAKRSKEVYTYYFTYDGEWNWMKQVLQKYVDVNVTGAVHADDVAYVFNPHSIKLPFRKPSKAGLDTKARMLSFISNFVKTGNPTPTTSELIPFLWEPATDGQIKTMQIGADIKMEPAVLPERMAFWSRLILQYV